MHIAFIPYGARQEVERLMRDMESQKFKLCMTKEGQPNKYAWITGQVRVLPFGVAEIVFPREYKDTILNTMMCGTAPNRYGIPKFLNKVFRKALKLKPVLEYKKIDKMLWSTEHVSLIVLGIREDLDMVEPKNGEFKGWKHESI